MEKKCTKCGEVKSLDEFGNDKSSKDGKQFRCKICNKEYRKKNKEKIKEYKKEYYSKNKEKIKVKNSENGKEYRKKNKEKIKVKNKEYRKMNVKRMKKRDKKYRENNKEKINQNYQNNKKAYNLYNVIYTRKRRKTDFLFRLRGNISANIKESLKIKGYTKRNKTYTILKCDYNFFMKWLNGLASNGYTYGIGDLHLDHVVPISLAETEDEAYLLNHYSNYQLLSADENLAKSNRYVNPINLKRVLEHHPEPNKIKEIYSRL
jgi:hypothetical protein